MIGQRRVKKSSEKKVGLLFTTYRKRIVKQIKINKGEIIKRRILLQFEHNQAMPF